MIIVIALIVWALAALPIAIALGRLCSQTGKMQQTSHGPNGKTTDADSVKRASV